MSESIEMEDIKAPQQHDNTSTLFEDPRDSPVALWAWGSATLLIMLSLPLILFPRLLLFLSAPPSNSPGEARGSLTPLESYLSTHFGIFLVAIAAALVLNIPSPSPVSPAHGEQETGHPLLGPLSAACVFVAFVSYNTKQVGALAFFVSIATAAIGAWGLWVAVFEGTSRISKKTGADKHTSAFLFGNKNAASIKKKEWKKARRD